MRWVQALILVGVTAACTGADPKPTPDPEPTTPSVSARRLEPGTSVNLTATVVRVLAENAFLVADTDLPPDGQVVVSGTPVTVHVTDVVTVGGRVERFDAASFARYGVSDPQVHALSGGVVVVATSVRRYLPESAPPVSPSPGPSSPSLPSGSVR
jgi:hypothetical protein